MNEDMNQEFNIPPVVPHPHKKKSMPKYVSIVVIPIVITIVLLLIAGALTWHYRARIYTEFAKEYASQVQTNTQEEQNLIGQDSFVVPTVKKVNPAVVAITISKNVPKYEEFNQNIPNPFGDIFGGLFSVPQLRQNGTEKKDVGGGSGFLVSENGYIVTNKHVVDDAAADYTVLLNDGTKHEAKVIAKDSVLDIAIIKIDGTNFPALTLGNSDSLQIGQSVIAIGNALGEFRNTVSVGIVSGLARSITAGDSSGKSEQLDQVIQTDTAINPGNSGGPLLDLSGDVVGVNVAIVQGSQNVGFALPINSVKSVIDSVKKTGKIIRPYLGLRYQIITDEIKKDNNITADGVIVKGGKASELAVIPGSPADKAGIVENDIITAIDGKKLDETTSLATMIRGKNVGDVVTLSILHKGEAKTVQVTLEAAPEEK